MKPRVLLLHGLWMHAPALRWLATRLRGQDFDARAHGYYSVLEDTPKALAHIVDALDAAPGTHVVAHSLGGLLALQAMQQVRRPGRVVCLGSPLAGSGAARAVQAKVPGGRRIIGPHAGLLMSGVAQVPDGLEVGMVAGCRKLGLGGIVAGFDCDHDGTVAVAETRVPGLAGHVVVPASHSGLIWHDDAAAHAAHFLRHGRFEPSVGPGDV